MFLDKQKKGKEEKWRQRKPQEKGEKKHYKLDEAKGKRRIFLEKIWPKEGEGRR